MRTGTESSQKCHWVGLITLFLVALGGGTFQLVTRRPEPVTCPTSPQDSVVVATAQHALALCENGRATETFLVRLGRRGTGKSREGDGKTPLGRYAIGEPRPSSAYGTFVPIAYPTLEQRRRGLSGSAVGVHGPTRWLRRLGGLVNLFDTTDGCVGLATDAEMQRVATWVREHREADILLR